MSRIRTVRSARRSLVTWGQVYEAFLADPLVKGRASEAQIEQLVDDMIANTAHMLPAGWRK